MLLHKKQLEAKSYTQSLSIFSQKNYERIRKEKYDAINEQADLKLSALVESSPTINNFLKYKETTRSASYLYRARKSPEQIREDAAVEMFFRKQFRNHDKEYWDQL